VSRSENITELPRFGRVARATALAGIGSSFGGLGVLGLLIEQPPKLRVVVACHR
jgi:hypothetical protein